MRYQPQGAVKLRRLRQVAGAQSIIVGGYSYNVASGVPLRSAGVVRAQGTPKGLALAFRKNGYAQTEVLPAIGAANFVEFWYGVPVAYGAGGNSTEAGFLTGSNTNASGIYANWRNGGATWGAVLNWPTPVDSGEVLPLGALTLIVVARYQDRVDLWRDGRLVKSLATAPYSHPAETLIVGSFIEDTGYWSSSSDTLLAGRIVGTWSAGEIRQFSANPWSIFEDGADEEMVASAAADTSLASAATARASAGGTLTTSIKLAGAGTVAAAAAGALATAIRLAGTAAAQASGSGALATAVRLSGAAPTVVSASGVLATSVRLAGAAQAQASATGALSTSIRLSGAAQTSAAGTGTLATSIRLAGTAYAAASGAGALVGANAGAALSGAAIAIASGTGALTARIGLAGGAFAQVAAAGALATRVELAGAALSQAVAAGALTAPSGGLDISRVSPARIAVFEGSGSRVSLFGGSGTRVAIFSGSGSRVSRFE